MNIVILTPDKEVYKGSIKSVKLPGTDGGFEVLKNHAPLVSSLGEGKIQITTDSGEKQDFTITKGFAEVLNNEVSVLVEGVK